MKKISILVLGFVFLATMVFVWRYDFSRADRPMVFGVTFSAPQAEYLGLDWRAVYLDMLDNLKVKNLRLLAYWNQIEETPNQFNFIDLDWQVAEAVKNNAKIIMTIGRRLPHWPECHSPEWTKDLSEKENQAEITAMIQAVVEHYKNQPGIVMWQVDNEPLVSWFGSCPEPDRDFVKKEIALVKSLDSRPVLITDSGELSSWVWAAHLGDYFGTTMYRVVWNKYIGYWS
ncbi:MAG: beta-galactosidase, partial [Candidatus Komeilibacteria bacterium]|nr:beta-galactosidase [Candidatus Komeilibacteria bacterium]